MKVLLLTTAVSLAFLPNLSAEVQCPAPAAVRKMLQEKLIDTSVFADTIAKAVVKKDKDLVESSVSGGFFKVVPELEGMYEKKGPIFQCYYFPKGEDVSEYLYHIRMKSIK